MHFYEKLNKKNLGVLGILQITSLTHHCLIVFPIPRVCEPRTVTSIRFFRRMLIAMVTIFGVSWLPLTAINLLNDFYLQTATWKHYYLFFFAAHAVAMSSTCYNPFLYAWLNENFRKEFKQVLPCWRNGPGYCSNGVDAGQGRRGRAGPFRSERTCNGNDTCQETLLPTSVVLPSGRTTATTDCTGLDLVVSI